MDPKSSLFASKKHVQKTVTLGTQKKTPPLLSTDLLLPKHSKNEKAVSYALGNLLLRCTCNFFFGGDLQRLN